MFVLAAFACESMEPSNAVFTPVKEEAPPPAATVATDSVFVEEPSLELSSEQMQGGGEASVAPATDVAVAEAPPPVGVPSPSQFPIRVVSTLPQAQPPRAILGLPSGAEVVVAPGSMLAEEGLVVMSVTAGKVQLARVEGAGDHARIEAIEVSAQY